MSECNKNTCKPQCNPCSKQSEIFYCGKPIDCLNINRGDKLRNVIKIMGDKICQLQGYADLMSYVNVIDALEEDCPYGGYVIQTLNTITDEVIDEYTVCNESVLQFFENENYVSTPSSVSFNNGYGIDIEADDDGNGHTSYVFSLGDQDFENITWQEGIDLMDASDVKINQAYFVTDRGWYLHGLTNSEFSIDGHITIYTAKNSMYDRVWSNYVASYSVDDLVVRGGVVWRNLTGNKGTKVGLHNLDTTNWILDTSPEYYENITLRIHVDYRADWVYRYYGVRGNVIDVPQEIYGTTINHRNIWADWGNLQMHNNHTLPILNNKGVKDRAMVIFNKGYCEISENMVAALGYNNVMQKISNNKVENLSFNSTHYIMDNVGTIIIYNKGAGRSGATNITGNVFEVISSNIVQGGIFNNNTQIINQNAVYGNIDNNTMLSIIGNNIYSDFSSNTKTGGEGGHFKYNNVFEVFSDNVMDGDSYGSMFRGEVKNNLNLRIRDSDVNTISNNEYLTVVNSTASTILSGNNFVSISFTDTRTVTDNTGLSVDASKIWSITNNTSTDIINVTCTTAVDNIDSYFSTNSVEFTIGNNNNIQALNNTCVGIAYNTNIEEIRYNHIIGAIANNDDLKRIVANTNSGEITGNKATGFTDCEIFGNTNSGNITRNIFDDDSLTISNNNNNGNIGTSISDTIRATSVLGVTTDL